MSANDYQIGGGHYKTSQEHQEHWDLVLKTGMGYFEGQTTRYVMRWRKKDGLKDLQKALHYINKMIENVDTLLLERAGLLTRVRADVRQIVSDCVLANDLMGSEHEIILRMVLWFTVDDLRIARSGVLQLMEATDKAGVDEPEPVPLEDSNKHAPRAGEADGIQS